MAEDNILFLTKVAYNSLASNYTKLKVKNQQNEQNTLRFFQ